MSLQCNDTGSEPGFSKTGVILIILSPDTFLKEHIAVNVLDI